MSKIICRICGHKKEYHYDKDPVDDNMPLPNIGCIQCNGEYRACPGFRKK